MGASVGGGSVAGGGGFDFADMDIEGGLHKYVKKVQIDLLREIDNEAILAAYGIDVVSRPRAGTSQADRQDQGNSMLQAAVAAVI